MTRHLSLRDIKKAKSGDWLDVLRGEALIYDICESENKGTVIVKSIEYSMDEPNVLIGEVICSDDETHFRNYEEISKEDKRYTHLIELLNDNPII